MGTFTRFGALAALLCITASGALAQQPPPSATQSSQTANPTAPATPAPASSSQTLANPPVAPGANSQQPQSTIVSRSELVQLVATVSDHHHKFVTDLDQNDFHISDNGHPQQITFFSRQTDLPLRIALLMDTSNSIRDRLHFEQDASIDFLTDTLRRHRDQAFVMTFDNEPQIVQDYTGDLDLLAQAIQKQRAGGGTALNDAIYKASQHLLEAPPASGKDPEVRRVLVVFSDGEDNLSDHAISDAMDMAQRAGIAIYAISTDTDWVAIDDAKIRKLHKSAGETVLKNFAEQTGGQVFFPYSTDDLASSFQDIGNELRSQYLLAFLPQPLVTDGKFHKIEVKTDYKDMNIRTRRGYYAPAPDSKTSPVNAPPAPGE